MISAVLPNSKWKGELGSSEIGRHSGIGMEDLDPRVPDLVCSKYGRLFFPGLDQDENGSNSSSVSRLQRRFLSDLGCSELGLAKPHYHSNSLCL